MEKEVKEGELTPYEQKICKRHRLTGRLQLLNFVLVVVGLCVHPVGGLVFAGFSLYSWYWYYVGYKSQVVDEWEDGYVSVGLRYLFRSWLRLAIIAGLFWLFYELLS